jgi:septal ring-binding cell division protein DamX/type II secretory pathway predicted ATPase ExeA
MKFAFGRTSSDSADSPPYLSLLNLHTAPFATKAETGFFYGDAERTQYLDMLQHLTQYSEELLLVVGDAGMGKSALLEKYLERSEEHWRLCQLNGGQGVDLDGLFQRVADCFAVELGRVEAPQLLDALRQHLDALLEQQLSVMVIDDAHALSDDALEMVFHLAALEGEHGKLIRVLLFADSTIEVRLASERFAQITAPHRLQLKPLAQADSSSYLLHRLQQAGYSGASPFSAVELKQLHRQSQGVPAQLNQAAHQLLLARIKRATPQHGPAGKGLRMGVAAAALIGTVLGMHDRINDLLGGNANNSMAVSAERPVLRLADSNNPWAVVIRDGENIQISCGAPAAQTEAVRPVPAAAPIDTQAVMSAPLIHAVSVPQEEVEAAPQSSANVPEPVIEPPQDETPAAPTVTTPVEHPATPSPEESPAPLVIKAPVDITPELPPVVAGGDVAPTPAESEPVVTEEPAVTPAPAVPEVLSLDSVLPAPVIGSDEPQTITILGHGLEPDSKVAVSWSGKVKALDPSQVAVRDSGHMELTLTTGVEAAAWAVQVSSPSQQRSNVLRFQVEAPKPVASTESGKESLKQETKTQPQEASGEMAAETQPEAPAAVLVKKAEPENLPEKKTAVSQPLSKKAAAVKGPAIEAGSWVAAQPQGNFTLQLLAASEEKALQELVAANPGLAGPFGRFEQERGGRRLYVLTQGSYPGRKEAEAAAKGLPAKLQPWIRDFAGIRKVMLVPTESAPAPVSTSAGGIKDTAWVWSQNPSEYTIQLAGAADEAAIEAVMIGLSLPGEMAVVESLRNGQLWYTLIYGRFASKDAAQATVGRLPAALKKEAPWIRQFSALQGEIAQATDR